MTVPPPIANSYWVVPGKLLAGEYPINLDEASSRAKMGCLTTAGVRAFIDLTEEDEPARGTPLRPYADLLPGASHQRFPIKDVGVPDSPAQTAAILNAIDDHIAAGRTVYVHCWGGVGRTGTIIGCWLARHGYPGAAALERLRELWLACPKSQQGRRSPDTPEQEDYIRNWREPTPIANSYWAVPGQLLAGEYPIDRGDGNALAQLLDAGIAAFIDLTEEREWSPSFGISMRPYARMLRGKSYQSFPIRDVSVPGSPDDTYAILNAIDRHIKDGRAVYVHCRGGVGRTGTIIGCWLVRQGYTGDAALERLQQLWAACSLAGTRASPDTDEQRDYIRNWREPMPIPNSYWVVPGKLLAGEYPIDRGDAESLTRLRNAGISAFVDLTREREQATDRTRRLRPYAGMLRAETYQRFPIRDHHPPHSPTQTAAILDAIDGHIAAGRIVYVHCRGGVGRTGTVIGCWLVRQGYTGEAALQRVQELWDTCGKSQERPVSPERSRQREHVRNWREPDFREPQFHAAHFQESSNMTDHQAIVSQAPALAQLLDNPTVSVSDRARGAMLGLAAGNLLGLPVESRWHHEIAARYPQGLTEIDPREARRAMDDDLAQAVDLAESLLAGGDLASDFARRLIVWARENGRGIGLTTAEVIDELTTGKPFPEPARIVYERKGRIAPNGGVMRCAPVAIASRRNPARLVADSAVTCAVTHYAPACQWSCIIINAVIARLLDGAPPNLASILDAATADGCPDLLGIARADGIPADILDAIAAGRRIPPSIDWMKVDQRLIGHTLLAMQAGLWAAVTPLNLEDALIALVSAGGDTDTNPAVAGAVLGARYGAAAIPQRWLDCIPQRARIEGLADRLLELSGG